MVACEKFHKPLYWRSDGTPARRSESVGKSDQQRGSEAPEPGELVGVGLQFAGAIVLFLFLGRWLDSRFGTEPWLLVTGVVVGAVGGFYSMYRRLVVAPRRTKTEKGHR